MEFGSEVMLAVMVAVDFWIGIVEHLDLGQIVLEKSITTFVAPMYTARIRFTYSFSRIAFSGIIGRNLGIFVMVPS